MMTDPYKTLNIPSTATDDEVKQAYRRLAKRYHPDANPGDRAAEQRMQEINAAYDEIMNRRTNPNAGRSGGYDPFGGYGNGYGSYGSYGSYGGYGNSYSGNESGAGTDYYQAARSYVRFGRYREALNVLGSIQERNAEWYYISAIANAGVGNRVTAQQHAERAVQLEPNNVQYRELLERIRQPGQTYTTFERGYSSPLCGFGSWRPCFALCLADVLCRFLCRPC